MTHSNDTDIEVFWYDLENIARFNKQETINCGVIEENAQRYGTISINVAATRLNNELVLVHITPTDTELTSIIDGLVEARRRLRVYRGENTEEQS